jgi:hypothetical protein
MKIWGIYCKTGIVKLVEISINYIEPAVIFHN